jgi:hypothetical protein
MRISTKAQGQVKGNAAKFDSYREALARIKAAQADGYYLEAIAIEESIIVDRIISYLQRPGSPSGVRRNKYGNYPTFNELIKKLAKDVGGALVYGKHTDLCTSLHDWRRSRNRALHAFVSSDPGTPTNPVDDFLRDAKKYAEEGADLARTISKWHRDKADGKI